MRLLLDAHVSGRRIGGPLRRRGHDVRALDQEPALEGLSDPAVLELAGTERRILVTFEVSDFPRILREWAEGGRPHGGVILVYGLGPREYGAVLRGIERVLERRPRRDDWTNVVELIAPARARS